MSDSGAQSEVKHRDPFLNWLLVMVTFGQFAYVWTFLLARDVNRLAGAEYIRVGKHARIFAGLWVTYIGGGILLSIASFASSSDAGSNLPLLMVPLAFGLLGYFFWLLLSIAEALRREGVPRIPSDGALFFYSLFYMSSLPLLQSRLNNRLQAASRSIP